MSLIDLGVSLHEPQALLDIYLPPLIDRLDRPHVKDETVYKLRTEFALEFERYGWDAEVAFVAFDLICAFAERIHETQVSGDAS